MTERCGRLELERYICGELNSQEASAMKQHLEQCADCMEMATKLEAERGAFLQKHPFIAFTRAHAPTVQLPWYRRIGQMVMRPALVPVYGVVIATLVAIPYLYTVHLKNESNEAVTRFKGKNTISYIYLRDGITHQPSIDDDFRAGDRLQILYSSIKQQYLSLVSIDTRGTISFYHPDSKSKTCSIPVTPGSTQTYPVSIELDDTPGAELVIALFSDKPLSTTVVSQWVMQRNTSSGSDLERLQSEFTEFSRELPAEISVLLLKKE